MNTVTMVDLRRDAEGVLRRVRQGERLVLTYRGRPAARLEPVAEPEPSADDPFYRLVERAGEGGASIANEEIDEAVHGR